jgi:hypothetical protein
VISATCSGGSKIQEHDCALSKVLFSQGTALSPYADQQSFLELSHEHLLTILDAVVKQYEIEASSQVRGMRNYVPLSSTTLI